MTRILYTLSSEGMGHAVRSRVVLEELKKKHNITICTGTRAKKYLEQYFPVTHIHSFHLLYKKNKVRLLATFFYNIKRFFLYKKDLKKIIQLIKEKKIELIVTDYEPLSCYAGARLKVPVITLDNNSIVAENKIEAPLEYIIASKPVARLFTAFFLKRVNYRFITTFFFTRLRKPYRSSLYPPLLRPEVRALKPRIGKHLFVYQTSTSNTKLLKTLEELKEPCIIYGFHKKRTEGLLHFKTFNEKEFLEDLASSKAVITNGGFTVMTEALYLGKPVLSQPVRAHFEQYLNAYYLKKLGYGMKTRTASKEKIKKFLDKLPQFRKELVHYHREGPEGLFKALEKKIQELSS